MSVSIKVNFQSPAMGGLKIVGGTALMNAGYNVGAQSGDPMNLANYFNSNSYPVVCVTSANGYILKHTQGTAANGAIRAYQCFSNATTANGLSVNFALQEVHNGADLSGVNFDFIAIGQPY